MATEEEAREAADGQEVQVESVDLGMAHLQMHLDGKLSSNKEIKNEAKIMDLTEGMLKITEDQVLEEAPSVVEIPPEHTTNGKASSLNGHMEEEQISNEQPQENDQKDKEKVEASPDGISTGQSNKSNGEEAIDSLGHGESTTEDTSHLKHGNEEPKEHDQQCSEGGAMDDKMMHDDKLKTDNDVEPTVHAQQGQNLESAKANEDIEPARLSCSPDDEVVSEAPVGVQTSLEPNVNDSDALRDASDGNTETVEPTKVDKESCPEAEDIAEHTDEIVKQEDQQSKQTDDVDADMVQEEIPRSKETAVPEDTPKTEQADGLTNDAQEVLNQESPEETSHPLCKKTEETSHERNTAASEEMTPEHDAMTREQAVDIQEVQNQGSVEQMKDAEEADTEKTVQQSSVAFEEAIPEDHVATSERSSDIEHLDSVESEEIKALEDAKAEESCPEAEDIAEHTDEIVKLEDQQSKQTDDVDADMVQEEIPRSKETAVPEDTPKTEQADGLTNDAQEVLNQESPEETSHPLCKKTEETSHERNTAASEEITPEHDAMTRERAVDIQEVQNQGSVEEMKDAKEADTEKTVQQSSVAFEEAIPEDHVATTERSSDIEHLDSVESEEIKALEDAKAEEISDQSNVAFAEDAVQDKEVLPSESTGDIQQMQGFKQEESKSTETVEMDEASNQTHEVFNDLAEEDSVAASEPHVTELEEEVKNIEDTETPEITQQSHAAVSEELVAEDYSTASEPHNDDIQQALEQSSVEVRDAEAAETQEICHERTISAPEEDPVEDDVTAGPTCDAQEVQNVESAEEIKDNTAENIVEVSNVAAVEEADQENNVLASEDISEKQMRGLEPEEIKNAEPVETEEAYDQRHDALFNDPAPEDIIPTEMPKTDSTIEVKEIEATKTEAIAQESNISISEEPASEQNTIASETTSDTQEVNNIELAEDIEGNKDIRTEEISDQSNGVFAGEADQGTNDLASELESEEKKNVQHIEVSKACHQVDAAVLGNPTQEDNLTTSELHAMESAEARSNEATEGQEMSHQNNVAQSEDQEAEENTTASEPQILEPEPDKEMKEIEATEPRDISQQSIVSTSEELVRKDVTAKELASDKKEVQHEEPELIKEHDDEKAEEISNQSSGTIVVEAAQENKLLASDPANDVQAKELELQKIGKTEGVGTEEASHQTHAEENLTASEPQMIESSGQMTGIEFTRPEPTVHDSNVTSPQEIATEDNTTFAPDDGIQQHQEQESIELRDTEATEPQGISPSHVVSTSEESAPEDNVTTEPSAKTQAANLESATVTEDTEDVRGNVAAAEEGTLEEHVPAFEATVDIPPVQEPELEETKNTEPVETQDNITASELPAEEAKETEAIEIKAINELTEDVKSNALADEATPEEHVLATEATIDIAPAQEPELEEIKNTETVEVEDNVAANAATDLPAEEEAMETEAIPHKSTVANISELTEDVKCNVALADEAAPQEHELATEATVETAPAQEPELEEIKNTEPVKVEDNIAASDLPAEVEAVETEAIPHESTVANISELTKDVKCNVALAVEAAPQEHVLATDATVDIPSAQEPELEINNTGPVEVEDNIAASVPPADEMRDTEAMDTEAVPHETIVVSIKEYNKDDILTASAPLADIQLVPEQESVEDKKCTETTEYQGENQRSSVSASDGLTPREEKTTVIEHTCDTHAQNSTAHEMKDSEDVKTEEFSDHSIFTIAEVAAQESALLGSEPTTNVQQVQERDSTEETRGTEAMQTEHDQQNKVSTSEKAVPENNVTQNDPNVDDQIVQGDKSAIESKDIEDMETEEIFNQSNSTTTESAAQESSELGSELDIFVQSAQQLELAEGSTGSQLVKAEETCQSNVATLKEPTAEDNAANEIDPPADTKQEHGLETMEGNKDIDATEVKEAFHPSQGVALEKPASESNTATTEPTYDIQQVNDLEEAEEMKGTEAINDEEISCQKAEIDILEDLSPTDNAKPPKEHPVESNEENLGNEIDNAMLVNEKIKDEIQELAEKKDVSSDLDEKTVFTTQRGESTNEEDDVQISGEDTIGTSNNIEQIKEEPKAVTEHDSSQMSSDRSEENGAHVQDSDIKEEFTEKGTAKASEASVENDPLEVQDVAEKDDITKSGEHTDDQDNEQLHDVVLQMQVCDRSVDALAIGQQDEAVQKVNLDQQQKEDEEIEKQTGEIQTDEEKHDENRADSTTEPLLEPQSIEICTTNRKEDADVFEAEQTETVATEVIKNEQTLNIPQESVPSITDAKVENSTEIKEGTEEQNAPNNAGSLYADADAENYNEDEQENTEKGAIVAKTSTDEQDGTTDEIRNEEVGDGLASPVNKDLQKISDPAPSNEEILENNPTVVPENVESGVNREEKECISKVNDGMQAIQTSEKEIADEVEEKQEMQNEDNDVHHDEIQTKPEEEKASELHSSESNNADTKMDDTMSPDAEVICGRTDAQPREIEAMEENKEFSSISEYALETSKQNDVEQDLSIHHKVADEKLTTTEHNGVEAETDSNEKTETSYTAVTEAVKFDEAICDEASGADGALSDENLETFEDTRRNLDASSVVTASNEESVNEDKEHHKLALPAQSTLYRNATEQASGLEETERELLFPENTLPAEPKEHEESQITKEQDEEDIHEQEFGDTEKEEKEAEQSDLPVSNFLMNLIMGKESNDPDGNSEFEAEKKKEETTKDDSCLITCRQEESLVPVPIEEKVDDKLIFDQEKHNPEGSEETHVLKLETDEELSRNTHDSEAPVCEHNPQDEISSGLVPRKAPALVTEMETRDFKLGERAVDSVCQEHVEATTQIEEGSLKNNLDDSTSPKASQEDTLEEGRTDLLCESLPEDSSDAVAEQTVLSTEPDVGDEKKFPNGTDDLQSPLSTKQEESTESSVIEAKSTSEAQLENEVDKEEENRHTTTGGATKGLIENFHDNSQKGKGSEAISDEQMPEITEPVSGTEINLVHGKEISAGSACMDEKQIYKFSNSELGNSAKALEIQSDGPNWHINQDKQDESADNQILMEKNNLLDKPGESNLQEEQETDIVQKSPKESDEGHQHFFAIREPVIKEENVNRTVDSHVQTMNVKSNEEKETFNPQVQEHVVPPKEAPDGEENFVEMTKPEFGTDEEQSPKKEQSNMAEEKTYDEKTKDEVEDKNFTDEATMETEEQGAVQKASHNQKRDLDVVSPKEVPEAEENFVDVTKIEFSTDEEQSPKKDESNMAEEKSYDKKTKGDEEAKNFTEEAAMKIEDRGAGQKASPKKHNILSGVGSKVKHQLAKVKKAIVGKPGYTKSESRKS